MVLRLNLKVSNTDIVWREKAREFLMISGEGESAKFLSSRNSVLGLGCEDSGSKWLSCNQELQWQLEKLLQEEEGCSMACLSPMEDNKNSFVLSPYWGLSVRWLGRLRSTYIYIWRDTGRFTTGRFSIWILQDSLRIREYTVI